MKLADYLRVNGLSLEEFAERIGVATSFVSMLVKEQRGASIKVLQRISAATDGAVGLHDFPAEPRREQKKQRLQAW